MGVVDWDRRLFDSLIPLPDGTSYNAYLVRGADKVALLDTVDLSVPEALLDQLAGVPQVDYVVSHHAEQDHSGAIPQVLERYPAAKVVCSPKAVGMLGDLLRVPDGRCIPVADGETISLGGKTLTFIHTPWVHWPETMVTYVPEQGALFTCDMFGSHLATSNLYADWARVYPAAKRYYAEIMMPFAKTIERNLEKVRALDLTAIAPGHGPIYDEPEWILSAWEKWTSGPPRNLVVVAYVSMHGSTRTLAEHLVGALVERGVPVEQFELTATDLGGLATVLVDAATIVIGTPTVLGGPHPHALSAAHLAGALRPKARYAAVIGSYGWGGKTVETIGEVISALKVEILGSVLCTGMPEGSDMVAVDRLADTIAAKHREDGLEN